MKKLPLFVVVFLCVLFVTTASAQVPSDQARNFQIDATHTGSISIEGLTPPLSQRWVVNFGRPISYPLIADGRVFVTVKNGSGQGTTLFALNATNGSTLWSYNLGGFFFWSGSCYENGRVFALNGDGLLRAFDGATGAIVWSAQLPGQFAFSSMPTVREGVIYTGGAGSGGTVYAVNANTGAVLWTQSVANGDYSSPAVTSDGVYVSYSCPNVYKLDPATGALIWHYGNGCSGGGGKTPALYNNRLFVRDPEGTIHDSFNGSLIGTFIAKNTPAFSGSRGFFLDGPSFFGSFGTLRARDVDTNAVLWSFVGDGTLQSAVLVVNDYVYVGSAQGRLYALNAATGQQVWVTVAGTSIPYVDEHNVSQPVTSFAAGEGLLVVPTSTTLVAYERDNVPPTLTWGNQTPAANAFGWNNTPVDLPFTIADNSGVPSSNPQSPLHFTAEGANQTQNATVTDNAGNSATFTSPAVNIDLTLPVVTASANPSTASKRPQPVSVTISGSATDALSGIGSASFNVIDEYGVAQPSGSVTVQPNGSYSFTLSLPATKQGNDKNGHLYTIVVTALDRAGNARTATTTLTIN
ncbi:MAG TPA: PQQ-binding-like beta-propeller repeat protein [Pyrinomonadaceae bacterium]|nr:PQQ-binding-like beta-propeller repeat protein [Pyrinomonadaceae bacterium]